MAGTVPTASNTSSEIIASQVASKALGQVPVVGGILSSIAGLFGAAHTAALAKEASYLNAAVPNFVQQCQQVFQALNAGAISESDAIGYLQQAQQIYYTAVSGIIRKNHACDSTCGYQGGVNANAGSAVHCCDTEASTCNAACCLGCILVEPTVIHLTAIIAQHGGTYVIPSTPQNGQIGNTPAVQITYAPSVIAQVTTATLGTGTSTAINSTVANVTAQAKANPLFYGALVIVALVVLFKVVE